MPAKDQGVFQDRYQIIPRVLIFASRKDEILLLKGAPNKKIWANLYNGVGGHIEKGEDALTAAYREFKEETGLELDKPWLCAVVLIDTKQPTGIGMYVFRGETSEGEPVASDEGRLEWVARNEIENFPLVEDLFLLLPKILELKKSQQPLFAHYHYNGNDQLVINFNKNSQ